MLLTMKQRKKQRKKERKKEIARKQYPDPLPGAGKNLPGMYFLAVIKQIVYRNDRMVFFQRRLYMVRLLVKLSNRPTALYWTPVTRCETHLSRSPLDAIQLVLRRSLYN